MEYWISGLMVQPHNPNDPKLQQSIYRKIAAGIERKVTSSQATATGLRSSPCPTVLS